MPPTFAFDENISYHLASALKELGESTVFIPDECGGMGVKDEDWIPIVGEKGWFLISCDVQILKKPREREAYWKAGIGAFFLDGNMSRCMRIQTIIKQWPKIKQLAKSRRPPFIAVVTQRTVKEVTRV